MSQAKRYKRIEQEVIDKIIDELGCGNDSDTNSKLLTIMDKYRAEVEKIAYMNFADEIFNMAQELYGEASIRAKW